MPAVLLLNQSASAAGAYLKPDHIRLTRCRQTTGPRRYIVRGTVEVFAQTDEYL